MTIQELHDWAVAHGCLNCTLRIADAAAVSLYPETVCICTAPNELIINISTCEPIEWDDLPQSSQRVVWYD